MEQEKSQNDAYQMLAKQWVVIFWESEYKAMVFSLYLIVFYIL